MLITQKEYEEIFKDYYINGEPVVNRDKGCISYYINGVAARDSGHIYLTLREENPDIDPVMEEHLAKKKFVSFTPTKALGKQWGFQGYEGLDKLFSSATTVPLSQFIAVDVNGQVYVLGSGVNELEKSIPEESAIHNCRTIAGRLYVAGGGRYIARRVEQNTWEVLRKGIKKPTRDEYFYSAGFNCIDGFSESDIYAGGGKGDLWHFNGDLWRQITFPSNMTIESICCGDDGFVYIGAQSGSVFKGRDDHWVMVSRGDLTLPFRQMVWYQDRVWATSDYGVWHIHNDEVASADLDDEVMMCAGYISCNNKTLVIAGPNGVARLEDGKWDILVDCIRADRSSLRE